MKIPKQWSTGFAIKDHTLVISFPQPRRVISSAVLGGGIGYTKAILNHQIDMSPFQTEYKNHSLTARAAPRRYLGQLAQRLGVESRGCVGLMTAVDLRHLILKRMVSGPLWIEGFFTVGITNAVRVGEPVVRGNGLAERNQPVGTINIILVTNARLSSASLVGAVNVVTEGKTAAVLQHQIPSWSGCPGATGTGTDAIVFVAGRAPRLEYSGTHTKVGELIGRIVMAGMRTGLEKILDEPL